MATTRAATFSAKIRTLSEFQIRLSTNQQPPSNAEIITTLRYFQQTLIGFLKDFPATQTNYCEKFSSDAARWNLYPNLNYSALYYAIVNLLDVFPLITIQPQAIGEAILDTIKALMIFLERDSLEQLPLLLASQLGVFPRELDKQIVHLLSDCVFPFAINEETYVKLSVPGVLMLVLQQTHDPSLHTWIVEAAMNSSQGVYQDLLQVIAKGTCESRVAAANLLFHYWPFPNPQILHRKTIQYRVHAWRTIQCQSAGCSDKSPSVKRCYDPVICADVADTSPPIFLCRKCAEQVTGERKVVTQHIAQPMPASNATCQRVECQSQSRLAVTICCSHECTRGHNHVPMRLCMDCSTLVHEEGTIKHLQHQGSGVVWSTDDQWPTVESIVKLLRETTMFEGSEGEGKKPKWLRQLDGGTSMGKEIDKMADERRMLSRFGVWLMAGLCPPNESADPRAIGYIMQNVFEWFATTALLPSDSMGASLEQLKTDFVSDWINIGMRVHNQVFISSLCGECEEHDGRPVIDRIKEGLGRLLALMPYDVVSVETWSRVMPRWLEAIVNDCTEDNQPELKVLLCKIFEPDLCPLPFETAEVYGFMTDRIGGDDYEEMFNALQWLHQLSRLDITIPLPMILDNFNRCLQKLRSIEIPPLSENDLEEEEMSVHVVLVDTLVLQMKLNDAERTMTPVLIDKLFECMQLLVSIPIRAVPHSCHDPELDGFADCQQCQQTAFVQQMVMNITQKVCPKREVAIITTVDEDAIYDDQTSDTPTAPGSSMLSPLTESGSKGTSPGTSAPSKPFPDNLQTQTMCVAQACEQEEEVEECEFVGILPCEEMEVAMAEAVTHDNVLETGQVVTSTTVHPSIKGQIVQTPQTPVQKQPPSDFWITSVGRFRFSFEQLPPQLKMIHSLLACLDVAVEPDVEFFVMSSIKYLCLHCEALSNARREHRGFLIWTQENQMVPKLWERLRSDYIQVGELATHLLLHAMTLPQGEEMFWKMVHRDFTSPQWNVRFDAVGKAYVLAQMIKTAPVKANKVVQTCLASVFYHFIASLHDPNPSVAQRAIIALRAMPSHTLKLICMCFESQFDHCIVDRPLIIHAITMMSILLPDQTTLTFDFFIQRFETLVLESQLSSQTEENIFVQDLMHTDPMSELYQRKVSKARTAIENAATARSIVRHLKQYDGMKHQLAHLPSDPDIHLSSRVARWRRRGRLSEAALSARVKILKVVTMVRVVNRWREMAADVALGAASLVSMMTSGGVATAGGLMSANMNNPMNDDVSSPNSSVTANYGHGGYGRLREFTDEESNMCLLFNRVVDMENPERHTVYLVVSLFVTFLSNKNSTPTDEKANAKKQSLVFRHFNTLLGYSSTEKCFTIPPARLRKAAVCNAFISGLPEILDMNLHTGNQLLPTVVQLLIHLPSPQRLASDQNVTNYSLALLTQHTRHLWLHSLILILYKYRFDQLPVSENIVRLIGIVVKTLQNQVHECSDAEASNEIDTWDEIEEDDGGRAELIRPESLTVTTIKEATPAAEGIIQVGAVRVMQPTIVEPEGLAPEPVLSRKRSTMVQEVKRKKSAIEVVKKSCALRCGHCNEAIEMFDEETVSLCLIALETFLHREPSMAAPILFKILYTVTRLIDTPMYPWHSTEMFVPANSRSVAKQMLRVSLHHLSTSAICLQLFDTKIPRPEAFWSVIALSLADFPELSPVYFMQILMEDLDESWPGSISLDMYGNAWQNLATHMETFFKKYHTAISADTTTAPTRAEIENVIIVMTHVLKVQVLTTNAKSPVSLVEAFSKWLSESLHGAEVSLESLLGVCTACNRALIRERDKQCVTRAVVTELMQSIKFKSKLHEANYVTIANMVLQDTGEDIEVPLLDDQFNTAASEAIRPFLFEVLDFIADLHVIAKLKKETNSDALGGDLKVKLAEAIAVEMSRSNARDCRTVIRFIPWLMSPPSVTQAAPGAFADSVTNVRVLSWLLLGALHANHSCLPVPIECSQHMADYIHFVLAGFADQSKQSVVHMSALFHAFHLCQLWTVYCERAATYSSTTAFAHLIDFWARVTPAILQLLSHSKVLADMVNLHFLNTIQALQQVNSALLCQLYSMWAPILTAYHSQIPNQLRMKLDSCQNQPSLEAPLVTEWLKKVRYKISQVELQTSAASPYYTV
ncbi:hypothetical protein L5515_005145 [Caenorhabditis briggsae]|uniref:Uncoordinated protein 79 n=1 Tax=Caenorhabditis briggsae TaxID=6238 RepID=A0AAE9JCU8_CAEBR|nr:hypothetical protein L5515_005145 [Caenorhabditis briggsae]